MRTKRFISCMAAAIAICSCVEKPQPEDVSTDISINIESFQFDGNGGQGSVSVTSHGSWTSGSTEEWCRVIPTSGVSRYSGGCTATVICDANETHYDRECEIRFKCGDNLRVVTVKQNTKDLDVIRTEFTEPWESHIFYIPYWTNVDVTVTIADDAKDWMRVAPVTKSMELKWIDMEIDENLSDNPRTGHLTISHGSDSFEVTVTQTPFSIPVPDSKLRQILYSFDTNGDGCLTRPEALAVKKIEAGADGISNLEGLQYFTNLEELTINMNNKRISDIAGICKHLVYLKLLYYSGNFNLQIPDLKTLETEYCNFYTFDTSGCPALEAVSALEGSMQKVGLRANKSLRALSITGEFSEIDVTSCSYLEKMELNAQWNRTYGKRVIAKDNPSLTRIECQRREIEEIDISGCPALEYLDLMDNAFISKLDVSMCPNLNYLDMRPLNFGKQTLYLKQGQQIATLMYNDFDTTIIYL